MPTLIMTALANKMDGSIKAKAMTFLQKLAADDTTSGLHIEKINGSADPKARTGRVDKFWRAVLFRIDTKGEPVYVVHGVWPHDDAIAEARRTVLRINPINGLPEFDNAEPAPPAPAPLTRAPEQSTPSEPFLVGLGVSRDDLVERLGLPPAVADEAMAAADEDAVLAVAERHEGWVGLLLVDVAAGDPIDEIAQRLDLEKPTESGDENQDLIESFNQPAARAQFTFIEDQEELRRVIEAGDFGAWRIFLHPEQRKYVGRRYNGPFRLSGGAGTGKTVVVVHRARALHRAHPGHRILLTTFTTNLADALADSLRRLDPDVPVAGSLGQPGVFIRGVDALAAAVLRSVPAPVLDGAAEAVLGHRRPAAAKRTDPTLWRQVVESGGGRLDPDLANEAFLVGEYSLIVLPNRVRTLEEYLRVRRPGRGVALDRGRRTAVWELIDAYRRRAAVDGTLDFLEAAAVAAAVLGADPTRRPADHVLVDEGQDLSPVHWQMLRAAVAEGPDDLFIAEDSHQRIYGPRTVLGRYGIKIVGRSQRLTLNYRTTRQNLRYALTILEGGDYTDLEDVAESTDYRSARSGPAPVVSVAPTLGSELDEVVERVQEWTSGGTSTETIAVLVPDRYQRDRVAARLVEAGVSARAVDREKPPADNVLVMTMHRAKGMEFSRVVLTDVGWSSDAEAARLAEMAESERKDAQLRQRSLVYVAATRARDELVVVERR
ncbi:3'-5' exonuclease [Nakamurella sp.]|uniref:3'-5' exonuclease n=1 Tax=Nakamurella sp. TaxID=1869182 RepID=UPI003B3A658C